MPANAIPYILPRIKDPGLEYKKYTNFLMALLARRERKPIVYSMPFEITIDPSTYCHLSCPHCSVGTSSLRRPPAFMQLSTHKQTMDELLDTAFIIWYFNTGEPLLNKDFSTLVETTRGKEVFCVVSTSLSLLMSNEEIDKLLHCGLNLIVVSLDGASPETYSTYRINGDYDLVINNLLRLVKRKKELGLDYPLIEWRFLVFKHNQHEIRRARKLAKKLGVDLLEFFPGWAPIDAKYPTVSLADKPLPHPLVMGPTIASRRCDKGTTVRRFLSNKDYFEPLYGAPQHMHSKKCDWPYFATALYANGAIGPCSASNHAIDDFGHVRIISPFKTVWNNASYQQSRDLYISDDGTSDFVCKRCPVPMARDYAFRPTIRALIRNAPDWVLNILCKDPKRFFHDIDAELSPAEFGLICSGKLNINRSFPDVLHRLRHEIAEDQRFYGQLRWIENVLRDTKDSLE